MRRIVLSTHSQYRDLCEEIAQALPTTSFDVVIINEGFPRALKLREEVIRWCETFVPIASVKYQRDPNCLELANYAKTMRKPIVTVLAQSNYKPFGALGAISVAGEAMVDIAQKDAFSLLRKEIEATKAVSSASKPDIPNEVSWKSSMKTSPKSFGVFISYQNDTSHISRMIEPALSDQCAVTTGDPSKSNDQAIRNCQVFVAILSPQYESSELSQKSYELGRQYRKTIVPVIGARNYKPRGWLALAIAGKLYYAMPDHETAYKAFYDSSLMNDFCYAVKAFLQPQASEKERELCEIRALDEQLEECKKKLGSWPPKPRPKDHVNRVEVNAVQNLNISADKETLLFNYIHHDVTRMSFVPPKPLFDGRGVPVRQDFDAMCSYQWTIQRFVRDFYMDLHMRNLEVWIDIWAGMQGNINDSMANAVECSAVIVCFLTDQYQKSANCCLELKYALHRQKPIIFIKVQPGLTLLSWICDIVSRSQIFEMCSVADASKMDSGIPRIHRISELIRAYATRRPRRPIEDDVTEEVFTRREMLENALHWIHEQKGTARFLKCGRCGNEFDENSKGGCKEHTAYFMGGTIMAGRWVCCQQRSKDSPGCSKTNHTTTVLKWAQIPGHGGCYNWS